ncbi:transposase [Croceicoccus sp. F390]|uniref:Transposase n=1 Tax=Croceicoccus esteveae TaxID=3075597 RepID=A0ABU2ZLF4_9SPHN|nr:transposase [Croceicoccus sp. F390]MDT0577056.1 transposase [Croceicoccus sp. F390]
MSAAAHVQQGTRTVFQRLSANAEHADYDGYIGHRHGFTPDLLRFCAGHLRAYCLFRETEEMIKRGEEFQRGAVRIALSSGLPRKRVAADLGAGLSTLARWVNLHCRSDLPVRPDVDLARESEQLLRKNRVLKEERHILKKAQSAPASSSRTPFIALKPVRFAFRQSWRTVWSVETICRVLQVSTRGLLRQAVSTDQPADMDGSEGAGARDRPPASSLIERLLSGCTGGRVDG